MYLEEGTPAAQVPVLWALSGLSELGTLSFCLEGVNVSALLYSFFIVASRQKFRDLELLRPLVEFLFKNDNELQVLPDLIITTQILCHLLLGSCGTSARECNA